MTGASYPKLTGIVESPRLRSLYEIDISTREETTFKEDLMLGSYGPIATGLLVASCLFTTAARADGLNPGSLLIFPEYDNSPGVYTVLTVTNVDSQDSIYLEFSYVSVSDSGGDPLPCIKSTQTELLTPRDSLTLLTAAHTPSFGEGFVYVFAKNQAGDPIAFDFLVGSHLAVDGMQNFSYSTNPFTFGSPQPKGTSTELSGNGVRDLDGWEYDPAPSSALFPRFLGQDPSRQSTLLLIGLTGGAAFDTRVGLEMFNDNEVLFTTEYVFRCWDRVPLTSISGFFTQSFLQMTNEDPTEIVGAPGIDSGWFRIEGISASSSTTTLPNPVVLGVLYERDTVSGGSAADLPFKMGSNHNGSLFPTSSNGSF